MKRIFIISLLVFAASLRTVAADYHFRHFTKENGSLPYDAVRVLYEDSRGHIWIGTQNGLSVFDGKRFKIFDRSQFGVESDYVSSIAEAAGGDIWVGTDKGIVVYDIESGGFRTLPGSLVQSRVYAMQRDTSGIIWIGVNGRGLFKAKEDEVTRIPNLDISDVYRIAINKDGSLVLASYCNNIFTYDPSAGSESLRPVANGAFFKDDVEGIVSDSNDCLYVASKSRGLVKLELNTGGIETLLSLNPNQRPTNLSISGSCLLMSTTGGLVLYDIHTQEKKIISSDPEDPFSIGNDFVRDACFTKDGALVIGQENSGVSYHHPLDDRFKKYYYGMSGSVVQGFAQTSDSTLWIADSKKRVDAAFERWFPYTSILRERDSLTILLPFAQMVTPSGLESKEECFILTYVQTNSIFTELLENLTRPWITAL
ncbi:MAG: ligand-binding sensor domain-containing protein [Candidatus Cryptobacteroides sp.]